MKFKLKNNKLRIVAATSVTIFSLAVAFTGVYAWFSINKAVNGNGESDNVKNITGKLKSITFHRLESKVTNPSTGLATSFSFYKNASGTINYNWSNYTGTYVATTSGDTRIQLQNYTPIDQEHPVLLLFEFNSNYDTSKDNIEITATSRTGDFLGARDAEHDNAPVYNLATDVYKRIDGDPYYGLSSIAYFYKKAMSQSYYTDTFDNGTVYTLTKSELTTATRFTTVDNDAETSSFQRQITIDKETSGSVKYIALVIDYYIDAIEFIYSTYLGDSTLESAAYDYSLNFICDWTMEVI